MSSDKYLSTQEILKRCFDNKTGKLKSSSGTYTAQDYFNAVYDSEKDALRISLDMNEINQTWENIVNSPDELPEDSEFGSIAPVVENGIITFYRKGEDGWIELSSTSRLYSDFIEWGIENKSDLSFLVDKKEEISSILGDNFSINERKIVFDTNNVVTRETVDENNETHEVYDMSIDGYVLSVETYDNNESPSAEKYLVKMIYNKDEGLKGTTHIYFEKDEFEYFSELNYPKNVAEIYTIENKNGGNINNNIIKEDIVVLKKSNVSPVKITVQNNLQNIEDLDDFDSDETTHYRIKINGYVLSVETYANNNATSADVVMVKTIYDSNNNITNIYLTKEEYNIFSSLNPPKNVIEIYFIENKTPSSNRVLNYKTLSGVDFSPKHNSVYYYDVLEDTSISFDVSYLTSDEEIEFELNLIQHETAFNIEFPENVVWSQLDQSNFKSSSTMYSIVIRYRLGKYYARIKAIYNI